MKAYKCDVCDKLYTIPTTFVDKTDPVTGSGLSFIPTGLKFTGDDGAKATPNHDVCQDCVSFFRKLIPAIRQHGGTDWIKID